MNTAAVPAARVLLVDDNQYGLTARKMILEDAGYGVETALSCLLGRMAGLRGQEVTWDELLQHGDTYELGFSMDQFA